jgi:hypothetical protein
MAKKPEIVIHDRVVVIVLKGKFAQEIRPEEVRVMARAEGYALVRKKGAMPFAVREKTLRPMDSHGA